jgi:DNA polymerase-3 subunit epsilon
LTISIAPLAGEPVERRILPIGLTIEGRRHLLHAFCYLRNARARSRSNDYR